MNVDDRPGPAMAPAKLGSSGRNQSGCAEVVIQEDPSL